MKIQRIGLSHPSNRVSTGSLFFALAALSLSGCAGVPSNGELAKELSSARVVPELAPGIPEGYLEVHARPDSLALLPPPPTAGSAAMAWDEEIRANAIAMRGSSRWDQARLDADLTSEHALEAFECALGTAISRQSTPRLYQLMQRVMVDSGYSTDGVKKKYQRARPFAMNSDEICTPEEDGELRADGSYPSGHTSLGWASALVLAQVESRRADKLIARGRSFGESRIICNVHWQSDVISGRVMGTATVARLQSVAEFREDVDVAREEVMRSKASGIKPTRDCENEASALAEPLKGAL